MNAIITCLELIQTIVEMMGTYSSNGKEGKYYVLNMY